MYCGTREIGSSISRKQFAKFLPATCIAAVQCSNWKGTEYTGLNCPCNRRPRRRCLLAKITKIINGFLYNNRKDGKF